MVAINFDPLALGFIESIARPGRNMTGLFFQHLDLLSKRFGLLKEMFPSAQRVAIFSDRQSEDQLKKVDEINRTVGLKLQPIFLQNPPYDFGDAFAAAKRNRSDAVFVLERHGVWVPYLAAFAKSLSVVGPPTGQQAWRPICEPGLGGAPLA